MGKTIIDGCVHNCFSSIDLYTVVSEGGERRESIVTFIADVAASRKRVHSAAATTTYSSVRAWLTLASVEFERRPGRAS